MMCACIFLHIFMDIFMYIHIFIYIQIFMFLCIYKHSSNLSSNNSKYSQNFNLILRTDFFNKRKIMQNFKVFLCTC